MTNNNLSVAIRSEENNSEVRHHDTPVIDVKTIEQFLAVCNQEPDANEVAINNMAANSKYIPISFIQMKLDKLFLGMWRVTNFRYSVVVNEICGVATLEVFHPIAKVWIQREGSAAVMIQQRSKKNGGSGDITNVGDKIPNTLQKDLPHLLASCTCAAARTFGKWFGRDLNRKDEHTDDYQTYYTDIANAEAAKDSIDWDKIKTKADLLKVWNDHEDLWSNKTFLTEFKYRKSKLVA